MRNSGIEAQDPPQGGDDGRKAAPGPAAIPRRGRTRIKVEYNILKLIEKSTFVTYSVPDDKIGAESLQYRQAYSINCHAIGGRQKDIALRALTIRWTAIHKSVNSVQNDQIGLKWRIYFGNQLVREKGEIQLINFRSDHKN